MACKKSILLYVLILVLLCNCSSPCAAAASKIHIEEVSQPNYHFDASYVFVDVMLNDIHDLQVYKNKGTIDELAKEANAKLAINCVFWHYEYYDNHIVFNNELLHELQTQSIRDYCVITEDGEMDILLAEEIAAAADFPPAWHIWSFGPALVHNYKAMTEFETPFSYSVSKYAHPRTAIGYFSPNHFCFLIIAGRNDSDKGATLEEMAKFFELIGCKEAYNLDGGGSSHIWYNGSELGVPCDDRILTEIIYISEEALQN